MRPRLDPEGPRRGLIVLGSLRSQFTNLNPRLQTLVSRWNRGVYQVRQRSAMPSVSADNEFAPVSSRQAR